MAWKHICPLSKTEAALNHVETRFVDIYLGPAEGEGGQTGAQDDCNF